MKAVTLIKNGAAETAFEIRETAKPVPASGQVLIKAEGFGLNFADVMARKGMYRDAPPLPSVLGYDVCGTVDLAARRSAASAGGARSRVAPTPPPLPPPAPPRCRARPQTRAARA